MPLLQVILSVELCTVVQLAIRTWIGMLIARVRKIIKEVRDEESKADYCWER